MICTTSSPMAMLVMLKLSNFYVDLFFFGKFDFSLFIFLFLFLWLVVWDKQNLRFYFYSFSIQPS